MGEQGRGGEEPRRHKGGATAERNTRAKNAKDAKEEQRTARSLRWMWQEGSYQYGIRKTDLERNITPMQKIVMRPEPQKKPAVRTGAQRRQSLPTFRSM